jgi:SAM-dependent methyltransferase
MNEETEKYYQEYRAFIEDKYLKDPEPWKQSGFAGPAERWEMLRRPIAESIDSSGSFFDIGCANGYLLDCLIRWAKERGFDITPYGLDLSDKLLDLARQRLANFAANFYCGNALTWLPDQQYDYVRTETVYVPAEYQQEYLSRLLKYFVKETGKLLVCEYQSKSYHSRVLDIDKQLISLGFNIAAIRSGYDYDGAERTRVAILKK